MAVYNLTQPIDKENFKIKCNKLYEKQCIVELKEKKFKRTNAQNNYLHLCLQFLALRMGVTLDCAKDAYYKRDANPDLYVRRVYDKNIGHEREYLRHSYELTTDEMSLSIDRLKNWAALRDCLLPDPEKPEQLVQAYQEVECNKQWIIGRDD